ncbi:bifunctional 4-hydroxy-2-oxoglutarate aldolase/2-dehydro-3-deoxy-phosphogluconate aldolase [Frigoribacterium sp. 2-23]|uniref:bifunctional 4-hydroxy-2-oxoglutarate aldolase/2-dehydro-3-deoxy-phosphogluconate aldolase n=1 Tax=Frigoribacterium sp. 2-23 TaxID=3415006 RepID=UPI003C70294A
MSATPPPIRTDPSQILIDTGVVAVLRAPHARDYAPVIEALAEGGVRSIELTLSTPGTFDELPELRRRFDDAIEIGVGTVTSVVQAQTAIDLGADYLVTPITVADLIDVAVSGGVPIYPGGLTPTELFAGWARGATAVKLFPASTVGPGYLGQLSGPFPDLEVVPSGGISIDDVDGWISAGALAVSLGGPLLQDAFRGGSARALEERARQVRGRVDAARSAR